VLKWEKTFNSRPSGTDKDRRSLIRSIHYLFNNSNWKADENKLNEELYKHNYIDFKRIVVNFVEQHELFT
jgi:hypothetical protein